MMISDSVREFSAYNIQWDWYGGATMWEKIKKVGFPPKRFLEVIKLLIKEVNEYEKSRYQTCGFCTEYDDDNYYCPHEGEMMPEDTCDGFISEVDKEAQEVDAAERENHRKDVEGEIV